MYPLIPFGAALAVWAIASLLPSSAAAQPDTLAEPDLLAPLSSSVDITPPPPSLDTTAAAGAPMPDHLADLQKKLRDHPRQRRAEQRVCEAQWSILLGRSNYYPKLNATLSCGAKWLDQTTRAMSWRR